MVPLYMNNLGKLGTLNRLMREIKKGEKMKWKWLDLNPGLEFRPLTSRELGDQELGWSL